MSVDPIIIFIFIRYKCELSSIIRLYRHFKNMKEVGAALPKLLQFPPQSSLLLLSYTFFFFLFGWFFCLFVCGLSVSREHSSFNSLVSCREKVLESETNWEKKDKV